MLLAFAKSTPIFYIKNLYIGMRISLKIIALPYVK